MKQEHIRQMHEQAQRVHGYALNEAGDYREPWRIFRIMAEFVEGYQFLSTLEREVTILGSARLEQSNPYCLIARELGGLLAKAGMTVITGGGPGVMEAANQGAMEAGGTSVGLNIQLPLEQVINPYVKKSSSFSYFFTRKVMLTSPANAFVYFPGGYGTLDEFFEVVDLIELGFMPKVPIVLVGRDFWGPILDFLKTSCQQIGSVQGNMLDEIHLADTAEEAFEPLKEVKDVKQACDLSPNSFHCEGNIDWKIFRVMAELVEGFDFLTGITNGATILGTKSIAPHTPYYDAAHYVGANLASRGYAVITGGKRGIAEAANKGAFEQGGVSIGIGMRVAGDIDMNPYLNKSILFHFPFTRKLIVTAPTKAFIVFPGGFGTLHQLFEVLTLMQTGKMPRVPVLLFDHSFWKPLHHFIKKTLVKQFATISPEDDELYQIVDEKESIVEVLNDVR